MARGVGPMPSDAAAPAAPPPQEEPLPEEPLPGEPLPEEPLPEEPTQRRTMSRWNQWLLSPGVAGQFTFEDGERIFEFSDSFSKTGWKPFDKGAQLQLRDIFLDFTTANRQESVEGLESVAVNCLGWTYDVTFDVFHKNRRMFANAPDDAIGYQFSNHAMSRTSKRWIRLTTFRVADRTPPLFRPEA